jgi:hypothetical protein
LGSQPRLRAQKDVGGQKNVLGFMHILTRYVPNIFKQEPFWELESQNVLNVCEKNANGYIHGLKNHFTYNHYIVPSLINA